MTAAADCSTPRSTPRWCASSNWKASASGHEHAAQAPTTLSRLQQLITEWERDSGQPVRRLNLRVASMMLAGALARAVGEDGTAVFITRGGIAMELRMGEKARVTRDVDLVLRGDPDSLLGAESRRQTEWWLEEAGRDAPQRQVNLCERGSKIDANHIQVRTPVTHHMGDAGRRSLRVDKRAR
jgi:hypothetical protein